MVTVGFRVRFNRFQIDCQVWGGGGRTSGIVFAGRRGPIAARMKHAWDFSMVRAVHMTNPEKRLLIYVRGKGVRLQSRRVVSSPTLLRTFPKG